jgi:hypothetical protein
MARGWRHFRAHGGRIGRARWLCASADGTRLRQVPFWQARSRRLYRAATAELQPVVAVGESSDDAGLTAHRALRAAREPYRDAAIALVEVAVIAVAAAIAVVLVASAVSPSARAGIFPRDLAEDRPWTASSSDQGYPQSGTGAWSTGVTFFHTLPSENPYVEIDLGAEHTLRRIEIENRKDCCRERALPLNVEVLEGGHWRLIAQRRAPFSTWSQEVAPVRARKVRVMRPGNTYLHLRRISLYER